MHDDVLKEIKKEWHGTYKSYAIGFASSIILTLISFYLVVDNVLSGQTLMYTLVSLALVQAFMQLLFFLHLGQEDKPRWETLVFLFMALVLFIIAAGTLWVMHDLDQRVMSPMHKDRNHD